MLILLATGLVHCAEPGGEGSAKPKDGAVAAVDAAPSGADVTPVDDDASSAADVREADAGTVVGADASEASDGEPDDAREPATDGGASGDGNAVTDDGNEVADGDGSIDAAAPVDGSVGGDGGITSPDAGPRLIDFNNLSWQVDILIEQSLVIFGAPQTSEPRNVRGLAASPDGAYLYAGYTNTSSGSAEVRRILLAETGNERPFVSHVVGAGAKAIAVDDVGRVYITGQTRISVYSPALDQLLYTIEGLQVCEGLAATREPGGALVLYTAERRLGVLERWVLTESGAGLSGAVRAGWGGAGRMVLDATADLRNVRVDPQGRIWVTGHNGDVVFRVSPSGQQVDRVTVDAPFDVGFDSTVVIVTHGTNRQVDRLDLETMLPLAPIVSPPWGALQLVPDGELGNGALAGLVVVPGVGFYVANESGATPPFPSPLDPTMMIDNNDPLLWAWSP
jgi:hypothetical protein